MASETGIYPIDLSSHKLFGNVLRSNQRRTLNRSVISIYSIQKIMTKDSKITNKVLVVHEEMNRGHIINSTDDPRLAPVPNGVLHRIYHYREYGKI